MGTSIDNIDHGMLIDARKMNISANILAMIKALYKTPQFHVSMDGKDTQWQTQHTGIRQGCPRSPYLFIAVMTVLFHDIHKDAQIKTISQIAVGTDFDEVVYANDTICIAQIAAAMCRQLEEYKQKETNTA